MNELFWQKLKAEKQFTTIEFPYALFLSEVESIRVKQTLRFVPETRLVVLADWQDKKVIVKFFISTLSAKRHFNREKNNILQLQQAKIDTPAVLFAGQIPETDIYFLVLDYLEHAVSLDKELDQKRLSAVCRILTKLHHHHYLHLDLHLDNFLIQEQKIYLIDFAQVKKNRFNLPLTLAQKLKNLALFAIQFKGPLLQQKILAEYLLQNALQEHKTILYQYQQYLQFWQRTREEHYLKKIFRSSTQFFAEKTAHHYFVCYRDYLPALKHFFKNPEQYLQEKKNTILKAGNTSTVLKFHVEHFYIVVKRYNIKSFIHALKRALQTSRAHKSWYYSHLLMMHDIRVPQPIAVYEKRFFIFKSTSYFLMEEIQGEALLHYLLDPNKTLEQKQHIVSEMKSLFSKLKQLNISHGDTKPMNYMVRDNNVFIIDLDGMQQLHSEVAFLAAFKEDQQRFLRDWEQYPDIKPLFRDFFSFKID